MIVGIKLNKISISVILILVSGLIQSFGQDNIPIGIWRAHLPYNRAQLVEISENLIFCSGENSLFYYDQEDFSLHKLTKSDGFSDAGITAMSFDHIRGITFFGYRNGNLDILEGNIISNYDAIKKISVPYENEIRDIDFHSEYAYLTTVFGVFVFRIEQMETKEVYRNLGNEGQHLDLNGAEILRDTIFLVEGEGVMAGTLDPTVNLMDFRNWRRFDDTDGIPVLPGVDIASDGSDLFALLSDEKIYVYRNGKWIESGLQFSEPILSITGADRGIVITTEKEIFQYMPLNDLHPIEIGSSENPNMALLDSNGKIWIADGLNGLVTNVNGPDESYFPSGPFTDQVFKVNYGSGMIITVPGGFDTNFQALNSDEGFSVYKDGFWTNYNNSGMAGSVAMEQLYDLTDIIIYDNKLVFASYGDGLVDFVPPDSYTITKFFMI